MLSRFSHVQLFASLWTVAHQAPLSMAFSRQEYCSALPALPPIYISIKQSCCKPRIYTLIYVNYLSIKLGGKGKNNLYNPISHFHSFCFFSHFSPFPHLLFASPSLVLLLSMHKVEIWPLVNTPLHSARVPSQY